MRIPFCPLPIRKARVFSKKFYGFADRLLKISPNLKLQLMQAEIDLEPREYLGIAVFSSLFMFLIVFFLLFMIGLVLASLTMALSLGLGLGAVMGFVTLFYIKKYPSLLIKKRVADIERNLLYSLRHLYVQVKSGVNLFDGLISISTSDYGMISKEFRRIVKEVNAGSSMEDAMDNLALKNPSIFFRRSIWQISNGMKAGSDIGSILNNIIEHISAEQKIEIRKYGSKLSPLTLVYMMVAVIIPALGITFLIVLSTFSGIAISETMFLLILGFLTLFQFMFLGIIKSKRPNIV